MHQRLLLSFLLLFPVLYAGAQPLLDQAVSVDIEGQPVTVLLDQISKRTHILFSYNSDIIKPYNPVSIHAKDRPVKQVLDQAFEGNMHYKERGKYIILLEGGERSFVISGYIENGRTGEKISNATIYESQLLAAALTDEKGYFRLSLKNKERLKTLSLTVRKEAFTELSLNLNAGYDQELVLPIVPQSEVLLEDVVIHKQKVESTWVSRFFLSSRQQIQALNIGGFIARRPVQTSLFPGLGTHGIIGAQVVNKFSLNMLGGYTAGVNGVEIGGLFNINKQHVQAVQVAGLFNNVGGNLNGVQVGGVYNNVIGRTEGVQVGGVVNRNKDQVSGVQVAGCTNILKAGLKGIQVAGVSNHVKGPVKGIQVSGVLNKGDTSVRGIQLAGVINWNNVNMKGLAAAGVVNRVKGNFKGVQLSGLINVAGNTRGMQIGLINIADTLDGYSFGLINYARNGHQNLLLSANEVQDINIGYRSGTDKLYSILALGTNSNQHNKSYSVSYGIGKTVLHSGRWSADAILMAQGYHLGDWSSFTTAGRIQALLVYSPHPLISIYAGPAYTVASVQEPSQQPDFMSRITDHIGNTQRISDDVTGWVGWQAGIRIFH